MAEQQKVTDDLTLIEVDIENAIMSNDLDAARSALATLVERSPEHPRAEFLQKSIDRADELQKLAGDRASAGSLVAASAPAAAGRANPKSRTDPRHARRARSAASARRATHATNAAARRARPRDPAPATPQPRTYGAPIGEPPRSAHHRARTRRSIRQPTTGTSRRDNNFGGRTVEASDSRASRRTGAARHPRPAAAFGRLRFRRCRRRHAAPARASRPWT